MVSILPVLENIRIIVIRSHLKISCTVSPPSIEQLFDKEITVVESKANWTRLLPNGSALYDYGYFGHGLP
jgi:hypothetical protein